MSIRQIPIGLLVLCLASAPTVANAQFAATPFSDPATGEQYHIEASFGWWNPSPDFKMSFESLGVIGTEIDAVSDLGIEQKRVPEFRIVLRPGRKHKFRLDYVPMTYSARSTLTRDIVFNGIRYRVNLPVTSDLSWKTWHLGYEYDFVYRDRWYVGMVLQAKATDVSADITATAVGTEFARARAPIPTIGGVARVYVAPNISITGQLDWFKIPDTIDERYQAHYYDFDLYGTVNFNNYVGAQFGFRSKDMGYVFEKDTGNFKAKGIYFGGVVRY